MYHCCHNNTGIVSFPGRACRTWQTKTWHQDGES